MKLTKNRAFQAHFFVPCIISEVHAPGNYEFAAQILFNARFRANHCILKKNDFIDRLIFMSIVLFSFFVYNR